MLKMSRFTCFSRGKILFDNIGPCKRFDILQLCVSYLLLHTRRQRLDLRKFPKNNFLLFLYPCQCVKLGPRLGRDRCAGEGCKESQKRREPLNDGEQGLERKVFYDDLVMKLFAKMTTC